MTWRSYLRTFLLAERQYTCRQTIEAEALSFMYRSPLGQTGCHGGSTLSAKIIPRS
ncbi:MULTISPECIES: hypothetical protein [unclassified Bradyrhizobium]|uniref:hypothetical protein n=1 Tax=unclassified Bradyrhizobium TaxID=2631580 RepID=UPI002917109A|nr:MULTISPECIES: hypothetical protein [unclassified Bradyrhizobium]